MPPDAWNCANEVARLDHEFADLIDHFMRDDWGEARAGAPVNHVPPVESFLDAGHLVIRFDLPGVEPSEVAITVDETLLTIKASRVSACDSQGRRLVHREIRCGNFERTISIPKGVVEKDLIVTSCHGVLQVIVPIPNNVDIRKVRLQIPDRARE